ncbi:hypothetical protein J6590_084269 [Homalodisca vitripennis]|nr:hypothetical protein J6590_084269 [Homalodisca vitripennis]
MQLFKSLITSATGSLTPIVTPIGAVMDNLGRLLSLLEWLQTMKAIKLEPKQYSVQQLNETKW